MKVAVICNNLLCVLTGMAQLVFEHLAQDALQFFVPFLICRELNLDTLPWGRRHLQAKALPGQGDALDRKVPTQPSFRAFDIDPSSVRKLELALKQKIATFDVAYLLLKEHLKVVPGFGGRNRVELHLSHGVVITQLTVQAALETRPSLRSSI